MKHKIRLLLLAAISLALPLAAVDDAQQTPRRIRFMPGATSARVTGRLLGWNSKARFVIRLRPGQKMNLLVQGRCDKCDPDIVVDSPVGAKDAVDPDMCQCRVEVDDTGAGDYRITVGENRKGVQWRGAFVLEIEVHSRSIHASSKKAIDRI